MNPHSGEQGLIGDEEIEIISPAVDMLCNKNVNAFGPLPADTAFLRNRFDGFLSMYHDQGLPVVKTVGSIGQSTQRGVCRFFFRHLLITVQQRILQIN